MKANIIFAHGVMHIQLIYVYINTLSTRNQQRVFMINRFSVIKASEFSHIMRCILRFRTTQYGLVFAIEGIYLVILDSEYVIFEMMYGGYEMQRS